MADKTRLIALRVSPELYARVSEAVEAGRAPTVTEYARMALIRSLAWDDRGEFDKAVRQTAAAMIADMARDRADSPEGAHSELK